MTEAHALNDKCWQPLLAYGFTHSFWSFNIATLRDTWIVLGILLILAIPIKFILTQKRSITRHLLTSFITYFMDMTDQALGAFSWNHFNFVTSLFCFIFFCNIAWLIPFMEEPTKDLNTTLALGIIAFTYTQFYAIKTHGILEYLKEYCEPFFLMFPLHVVGKLATIVSIAFRLYGNIFGGATISHLYFNALSGSWIYQIAGLCTANMVMYFFFGLFEGFLQAFVFTMLTITYLSIAVHHEPKGIS
jgi:F-type H+-transporting ATPase subunit a